MSHDNKEDLDKNLLEGHNYEGIKELDNPLPNWWLFIFFATIIFSGFYALHFHFGGGLSSDGELQEELSTIEKMRAKSKATQPAASEASLMALLKDASVLKAGAGIYAGKCASCHGDKGQGLIGPNLTDNYWIHGKGKLIQIVETVQKGILEKGMPPWENIIPDNDIQKVAVYIKSLQGSHPANPKEPQGDLVKEN